MDAVGRRRQVDEIVKCGHDPVYFINTYVKIQHPVKGLVPFKTYPFQDDCIRAYQEERFNIVLKSRQLGLSTISAAYATWQAIFYKDKNILVIATKLETAINFIKKVKVMLQSIPSWLLLPKFEDNKRSIRFNNGSVITAIPTSDDAGRSEALSLLIVDECAFIKNFEDIWAGLSPTISTGGRAILISTPNGVGGQYYKLWTQAEAGLNEFNAIRLMWQVHPEHNQEWFDKETRNLPKRKISQEFLCDFISSGDTFLQPENLEYIKNNVQPPLEKIGPDRNLWVWDKPTSDGKYVISADVSRGDGADYSAFHVIDASTLSVVAEYIGKMPPDRFAEFILETAQKYNDAVICPENNTFGYMVCMRIKETGYNRLYYGSNKTGDLFSYTPLDIDEVPGFSTQVKSRTQILANLEQLIRNKNIITRSQRLYDELQAFVWNGQKAQAMKDSHDDLVMALAIGSWIIGDPTVGNSSEMAMAQAMLKATRLEPTRQDHQVIKRLSEVGPPGIAKPIIHPSTVNKPQAITNPNFDYSWLYR